MHRPINLLLALLILIVLCHSYQTISDKKCTMATLFHFWSWWDNVPRDKVVCDRLCVCVKDGVWQSCVWQSCVCDKVVCNKVVRVCDKVVCEKVVCVTKLRVKDGVWHGGGGGREKRTEERTNQKQEPHTKMWGKTAATCTKQSSPKFCEKHDYPIENEWSREGFFHFPVCLFPSQVMQTAASIFSWFDTTKISGWDVQAKGPKIKKFGRACCRHVAQRGKVRLTFQPACLGWPWMSCWNSWVWSSQFLLHCQ